MEAIGVIVFPEIILVAVALAVLKPVLIIWGVVIVVNSCGCCEICCDKEARLKLTAGWPVAVVWLCSRPAGVPVIPFRAPAGVAPCWLCWCNSLGGLPPPTVATAATSLLICCCSESSNHLSCERRLAFMKKLPTVLSSSPSCCEMAICISFEGRFVSLKIACRVRRWRSVNTRRGFFVWLWLLDALKWVTVGGATEPAADDTWTAARAAAAAAAGPPGVPPTTPTEWLVSSFRLHAGIHHKINGHTNRQRHNTRTNWVEKRYLTSRLEMSLFIPLTLFPIQNLHASFNLNAVRRLCWRFRLNRGVY